jgi:hypothetical protein
MAHLAAIWQFTRDRVRHAYNGLTDEQLAWRCPETGASIARLLYHVAGSEHYWGTRLAGRIPEESGFDARLDSFALPRFLEDPDAISDEEMTRDSVEQTLARTYELCSAVVASPPDPKERVTVPTPEGEVVNAREGLVRLAQGTARDAGKIWNLRTHPEFPKAA